MNHMDIFTLSLLYFVTFTALLSLTPLGTFPPRPLSFTLPGLVLPGDVTLIAETYVAIPWLSFMAVMVGVGLSLIIALNIISDVDFKVLGSGIRWSIDAKYLSTVIIGFLVGGGLGVTMSQMLPGDVPLIVSFFLVWIWVILIIYSLIMHAGASG